MHGVVSHRSHEEIPSIKTPLSRCLRSLNRIGNTIKRFAESILPAVHRLSIYPYAQEHTSQYSEEALQLRVLSGGKGALFHFRNISRLASDVQAILEVRSQSLQLLLPRIREGLNLFLSTAYIPKEGSR